MITNLFPKVLYKNKLSISKNEEDNILNFIKKSKFTDTGENLRNLNSTNNICKDTTNKNVLDDLKFLEQKILDEFYKFKNDYLKFENDFTITTSWFVKSEKNQMGNYHQHKNCMYSGVYYFGDCNFGTIDFINYHRQNSFMVKTTEGNEYNSDTICIKPEKNDVIFFPSEIYHRTGLHLDDEIRYCLAFNLMPIGNFGLGDSKLYYDKIT